MRQLLYLGAFTCVLLCSHEADANIAWSQIGGQWVQPPAAPTASAPEGQTGDNDAERQTEADEQWNPSVLPELREQSDDQDAE